MKRYQKVLALLLISLMALSLSGCSLITITKAASNMSSLKSVSADLALNLNMDMTMMDETSPLEIAVSGPFWARMWIFSSIMSGWKISS